MDLAKSKTLDFATLSRKYGPFYQFSLLPHPDLANIRIRRLLEDGAEKVIEVNLAKIIAASTDQTTPEDARKADVMLQPGDVVEVSLLKNRLAEPWKGFTAQEETFFAKALGGRVQMTDKEGNLTVRDLVFQAPRFQETEIGWIPVPPETGIPSIRGSWLAQVEQMDVKRGEIQSGNQRSSSLFLRDGDVIQTQNGSRPRPRVNPPPPASQVIHATPLVIPSLAHAGGAVAVDRVGGLGVARCESTGESRVVLRTGRGEGGGALCGRIHGAGTGGGGGNGSVVSRSAGAGRGVRSGCGAGWERSRRPCGNCGTIRRPGFLLRVCRGGFWRDSVCLKPVAIRRMEEY